MLELKEVMDERIEPQRLSSRALFALVRVAAWADHHGFTI